MTPDAALGFPTHATPFLRATRVWLPALCGLLILYAPTYRDLAADVWSNERGAHGPIVLAMWLWLLWRERAALRGGQSSPSSSVTGWSAITLGLALYVLGRSQQMVQLEAGSQLAILPGICLLLLGFGSARRLWFVWLFLLFLVPMPGSLIDSLLVPLKEWVAAAVTHVLFHSGLPIARDGVVIYVGHYQLFIADACSGLNQLIALTAIGTLYVYAADRRSPRHNLLLLSAIVPVALSANFLRVTTLVLATYYGGDQLGQALHGIVGYAEIVLAFGAFFLLDRLGRSR